ncbi:MarR family winged helix-turn-helix transcriptional regulator [Neptuniibacter halophilus]|uniref:MarR family winged helix-turn-helix transcriptional regulator n=1 Tax=Neptuniibacter halophilus TaxID=651666 RepID=UPI0025724CB3|nr:MarR family transcriptional regulator [Neptuniibacter halophilus]
MNPQDCIFHLLAKASKAGVRCWKEATADLGITAVQGKLLNFLYVSGRITASELSQQVAIDNATMTGLLDRLEATGILNRQPKADDRRAIMISLTQEGEKLAAEVYSRVRPANEQFLSHLSAEQAETLRELLRTL